ncbi:putative membrane protein YtaF [Paenibacillus baekrokdamisoli]|uniref:Putative membrane protein YtaF n=1 Tax=Paenibacillus baekrokdamisoli TaxID=1712516 RepID=A0A3G9IWW4_9BACL|nr:manganese efflux pump [Paenibacillus baekrokdamisoli]MBB3068163.1 putative sporulation protein YtaF [Paenibacillus baekrokdamisoli]BBH22792.1 putative membrane protein YtaF [Paenibacillus baekrokdamisoli]
MHWLSIIGIGLAANLDNLGIGMSFGTRSTRIPVLSNVIIAILSMIAAYLSLVSGQAIAAVIPVKTANMCGGILVVLIGLWSIYSDRRQQNLANGDASRDLNEGEGPSALIRHPEKADKDGNNMISWRESLALGFALSINCLASGFGAGVTQLSPLATTLSIGLFSFLTIALGARIGFKLAQTWFGKYANTIGGMLLIAIGIYEIFV